MSKRGPRVGSNPQLDSPNDSENEEQEAFLTYSTPITKRKHRQQHTDIESISNSNSRSSSMERYSLGNSSKNNNNSSNNNDDTRKPRQQSQSTTILDEASTSSMSNEPSRFAAGSSEADYAQNLLQQQRQFNQQQQQQAGHELQQDPPYSKWSTLIHQFSFVATGIFSTIGVQWLYYQGAASGTTMITVFSNYIGMLLVGLVYTFQSWYSDRKQHNKDRTHVEYDVLTADINEMSEIGNDGEFNVKDHIELVRKKKGVVESSEIIEVREEDDQENDEDFDDEDEEKQYLQRQKEFSKDSKSGGASNTKSWTNLHWSVFQVAVMDVIANALVTIGFFYVGSGMYQVIYSSIVIWCAILTRIFLGRKLNGAQWISIFGVTLGLAVSAIGTVQEPSPDGTVQTWLEKSFGALITLGATFLYACVYVLSDKVLSTTEPKPIPEKVCSMVGGYASVLTFIYLCIHTFPNWNTEVTQVIAARNGSTLGIIAMYPFVTLSSLLHSLNYYVLLSRINNIAVGIMQSLRAVLVFVMSHYLFCGVSSTQCFNQWKFVSAIVVIGCVTLFSFNSPAPAHQSKEATSSKSLGQPSRENSPIPMRSGNSSRSS